MYQIQMDTICDGWVMAWEGAEFPFYSHALIELDVFLMEVKRGWLWTMTEKTIVLNL